MTTRNDLILHLGMLKSASTFLQQRYWNRFDLNVGKPLRNKTADLDIRYENVSQELRKLQNCSLGVLSDEALLTGGVQNEIYRQRIFESLGDFSVLPVVICRKPTSLVSSAIAYFSKGLLMPNFHQTANELFMRFPKLLDFLDYEWLSSWLQVQFDNQPLMLSLNELDTLPSLLEAKFGEKARVMRAGEKLSDLERTNESSPLRRVIVRNSNEPLYRLCPEWRYLEELDSKFDSTFQA